ncbi:hypothetical protein L6452_34160 [Arctium lappa]|uniref:Uncharacterized protein n=1 Tax=Arctium lappa TaxID=4217 RepID=A0ACB8YI41_ARCLA|nr:hypothetical protein L6452_34160 [Arctium lappa]
MMDARRSCKVCKCRYGGQMELCGGCRLHSWWGFEDEGLMIIVGDEGELNDGFVCGALTSPSDLLSFSVDLIEGKTKDEMLTS